MATATMATTTRMNMIDLPAARPRLAAGGYDWRSAWRWAEIEAASRQEAAGIYARAYDGDPQLYLLIRSLDALTAMVNGNTRLLLRTDAAPFSQGQRMRFSA